ncbi:MAG: hypothetical protein P1V20_22190 [Verrucomicrobiales bacterium]|nr:hypothetical protein [Verrucomicrobiales bacterium]
MKAKELNKWSLSSVGLLALAGIASAGEPVHCDTPEWSDKNVICDKEVFEDDEEGHPDENLWIYTKGTKVREKGSFEFKLKDISKFGKKFGSYQFHDVRPELEYGITDRFTVGVSAFLFHHDYRNIPWAPMSDRQNGSYTGTQLGGFEINTKYNILDPFEDCFGLSFGLAFEHRMAYRLDGSRIDQDSLVPQIFLQKSLMNDKLQLAFTGKLEFEQRKSLNLLEEEIAPDLAAGISYNVKKDIWVGFETRYQSDFLVPFEEGAYAGFGPNAGNPSPSNWDWGEFALGDQFQHGWYVGPTVHWDPSCKPWWVTAGALWQFNGWSAEGSAAATNNKNWDEHEKVHVGITMGYEWEPGEKGGWK